MLDSTIDADQFDASFGATFEEPVRERFKAAAAVSPRFLLLDFRYFLSFAECGMRNATENYAGVAAKM